MICGHCGAPNPNYQITVQDVYDVKYPVTFVRCCEDCMDHLEMYFKETT